MDEKVRSYMVVKSSSLQAFDVKHFLQKAPEDPLSLKLQRYQSAYETVLKEEKVSEEVRLKMEQKFVFFYRKVVIIEQIRKLITLWPIFLLLFGAVGITGVWWVVHKISSVKTSCVCLYCLTRSITYSSVPTGSTTTWSFKRVQLCSRR